MIENDLQQLQSFLTPLEDLNAYDRPGEAAVLVPIVERDSEWHLLLTKRAVNMRHHGGEVAFPGGMWEPGDHFPVATALREAEEEIALRSDQVQLLGALPAIPTRNNTQVTPVVGFLHGQLALEPNPAEIANIFYAPLSELAPDKRVRTDIFTRRRQPLWAPAYHIEGFEVWGFTAGVIRQLLQDGFGVEFVREHTAPEKEW